MPDMSKYPVGSGGRKRAQVHDDNVTAMATGTRPSSAGPTPDSSPPARQPAQPSSYAPSGNPPSSLEFGTPMQSDNKPRLQSFAEANAAELRAKYSRPRSEREIGLAETKARRKEIYGYDPDK